MQNRNSEIIRCVRRVEDRECINMGIDFIFLLFQTRTVVTLTFQLVQGNQQDVSYWNEKLNGKTVFICLYEIEKKKYPIEISQALYVGTACNILSHKSVPTLKYFLYL